MGIYVGTSGWAYASWKPDFYPAKLPAKKFLEYYATQLNSVEVNFTFRQFPTETMLTGWLAATGEDFAFSFKASQRITHFARLKNSEELVDRFYASLNPVQRAAAGGDSFPIASQSQGRSFVAGWFSCSCGARRSEVGV